MRWRHSSSDRLADDVGQLERRLGALDLGLELAGVDLRERLPGADVVAFLDVHA